MATTEQEGVDVNSTLQFLHLVADTFLHDLSDHGVAGNSHLCSDSSSCSLMDISFGIMEKLDLHHPDVTREQEQAIYHGLIQLWCQAQRPLRQLFNAVEHLENYIVQPHRELLLTLERAFASPPPKGRRVTTPLFEPMRAAVLQYTAFIGRVETAMVQLTDMHRQRLDLFPIRKQLDLFQTHMEKLAADVGFVLHVSDRIRNRHITTYAWILQLRQDCVMWDLRHAAVMTAQHKKRKRTAEVLN